MIHHRLLLLLALSVLLPPPASAQINPFRGSRATPLNADDLTALTDASNRLLDRPNLVAGWHRGLEQSPVRHNRNDHRGESRAPQGLGLPGAELSDHCAGSATECQAHVVQDERRLEDWMTPWRHE